MPVEIIDYSALNATMDDDWSFEEEWPRVLQEIVDEGYLGGRRPEDDVADRLLELECRVDELSEVERDLFEQRIVPLMHAWVLEGATFDAEYARRRASGFYDPPPDPNQFAMPF